ncbi:hypothetical protein QAD02_024398 [Eretmocerus hayati]|uniref:Uncharacterized protein n=2 Tax=Eretmocerus hayati TaxID=131215 RepID=A0ACC2Q1L8_9HYME|nr:hypothetical protein QAD02_023755 [Eretmocerus hayati]KAJ8688603.1 hypothetical protein QAD02_024398 [Eretmocerus hayati]
MEEEMQEEIDEEMEETVEKVPNRREMYDSLWAAFKLAFPIGNHESLSPIQDKCNEEWTSMKKESGGDDEVLHNLVQKRLKSLSKAKVLDKSRKITSFFEKTNSKSINAARTPAEKVSQVKSSSVIAHNLDDIRESPPRIQQTSRQTPSQDKSQLLINTLESNLAALRSVQKTSLKNNVIGKQINEIRKKLESEKKALRKKVRDSIRKKKSRKHQKLQLQKIKEEHPNIAQVLKFRDGVVGRPRIEVDQPGLLETILEIASLSAATDLRRQSDAVRSCRTLSDLQKALEQEGFTISQSGLYLRLIPKRSNSEEGKRHVKTVPVKLCRAQNDLHAKHIDRPFCHATIRALETLASILGPQQAIFLSQDDKARVPIGITAAKLQSPMLMHLEYKVSLPDHDFVVAAKHKLIPSVYAPIVIEPNNKGRADAVSYSGPTYIAIRSGKHSSSTADTHAIDLERMFELEYFTEILKTGDGSSKPVMIISIDGGPDENPRYAKVISCAIRRFRRFDLDALIIATNAPGASAFNRVERRMAPLSRELSGVILPHDHFGTHLDNSHRTIDHDLEARNFGYAGKALAEIWSNMVIDHHPVHAEYIEPQEMTIEEENPDPEWYAEHVRESQYCLQIVKCYNRDCCGDWRSGLLQVLKDRFLPPPIPVKQSSSQLHIPAFDENNKEFCPLLLRLALNIQPHDERFSEAPYDLYCPSVQSQLANRICETCGLYFASVKSVTSHRKIHRRSGVGERAQEKIIPTRILSRRENFGENEVLCLHDNYGTGVDVVEWFAEEDVDTCSVTISPDLENPALPVIQNLVDWMRSPWSDEIF